jgi:prepilin-type N-terminal cleavage/methylation domain-containing protein
MNTKSKTHKAFSLVELAIVILIIGIAIAGMTSATRLVYQFRVNSARSLTASSPVNSITGILAWFESTSDASFNDLEESDGGLITNWFDINPQQPFKYVLNQPENQNKPTYVARGQSAGLPVVQFYSVPSVVQRMATTANFDLTGNPSFTIFAVASATNTSASYSRLFAIGDTTAECTQFDLSYWGNNTGNLRFFGGNKTFSMLSSNMLSLFRVMRDSSAGASTVNGSSTALYFNGRMKVVGNRVNSDCTPYLTSAPFALNPDVPPSSNEWTVQIGEMIIFNRVLKADEVADIESYLSKKWSIKLN